jgi:hypothetical protein
MCIHYIFLILVLYLFTKSSSFLYLRLLISLSFTLKLCGAVTNLVSEETVTCAVAFKCL